MSRIKTWNCPQEKGTYFDLIIRQQYVYLVLKLLGFGGSVKRRFDFVTLKYCGVLGSEVLNSLENVGVFLTAIFVRSVVV